MKKPSRMPNIVRNALASAMPVTTPGRAIGKMMSSDTASRPKNWKRCSARAAIVPRTSAMTVAMAATSRDTMIAERAPSDCTASDHHCVVRPGGGQAKVREVLNELSRTSASGA